MPLRSLIAGSMVLLALSLAAQQQQDSAPPPQNPPAQTNPQKKDQQKKPSTAEQNPFPEAQSEAAAHQTPQQDSSGSAPDAPQPQAAPQSTSQNKTGSQNPFPQTQSEKAAHQAQEPGKSNPPAAPGSGDDQNYSSSQVKGLDMPDTSETPPPNLPPTALPYSPKLARKDSQIGDYYLESGNYKGAYARFLEANQSDPGNAEAVYGLAESARHLGRADEALRNYRLYLSALPNGPRAKEVRKALKEMGAAPAS
jgi:tetratricopeptide (TPR) repeat protein